MNEINANPNPQPLQVPKARKFRLNFHASWFLLLVVIVVVIGFGFFKDGWQQMNREKYYQAVHLSNGQVFFGKLQPWNHKEVFLTEVYYLQNADTASSNKNSNTNSTTPQFSLVKLGNELHGPFDHIYINKSQIIYTEDLKNDSQVVQAILKNEQAGNK